MVCKRANGKCRLTLIYEVDNIFGEDFIEVCGYPIPKATIRIGLRWDFMD